MTKLGFKQSLLIAGALLALGCNASPALQEPLDGGEDGGEDGGKLDAGPPAEMFSCSTWQPAHSEVLDGGLIRLDTGGSVTTFAVSDNRDQVAYQVQDGVIVVRDFDAGTELEVTTKRSLAAVFGTRLSSSRVMLAARGAKFQRFNFETCELDGPAIVDSPGGPNPSDDVTRGDPAMSGPYWSWTSTTVLGRDLSILNPGVMNFAIPDTETRVFGANLAGDLAVWQATDSVVGYPTTFRWQDLVTGWKTERFISSRSTPLVRVSAQWTAWVDSADAGSTVHVIDTPNAHDAGIIDLASGPIRPVTLSLKNGVVAWAESAPTPMLAWVDLNADGGVQRQATPPGFGGVELHAKGLVFTVNGTLYLDPSFAR